MQDWASSGCIQTIGGVDVPTFKCLEVVFSNLLTVIVSLAVLALFVMLVIGGFKYLTSGGDPKMAGSAKQTITFALIVILLMVVALLIFRIIEAFTGVNLTKFNIPTD